MAVNSSKGAVKEGGVGEEEGCFLYALRIRKLIDCAELSLKNSYEEIESWLVRIRGQGNKGNHMGDVYYRLPEQEEPVDEVLLLQLQEA